MDKNTFTHVTYSPIPANVNTQQHEPPIAVLFLLQHERKRESISSDSSDYIDDLVQDCSNSIATALDILQSCTKPSICLIAFSVFGTWHVTLAASTSTLQWRHNVLDSVSNHQPHHCLLKGLFRRRTKKTSKLRVTGLCVGNSPVTGEFPAQMASNAGNVSIWWRHHEFYPFVPSLKSRHCNTFRGFSARLH